MKVNTMASRLLFSLILFMMCVTVQAQVYKWVDAKGNVTYSDVPPPKAAVKVETKSFSSNDDSGAALPFELAQAVKNMPVTLYSTSPCSPCDDARSFLKQNGIPFAEKTVTSNADFEKLNKVSGGTQLPVLTVGKIKKTGFNFVDWRSNLTQAGYPESNLLPADYRFASPQPAAPIVAAPTNPNTTQTPSPSQQPANDPNGFKF
jgi:glutaredoxin